MGGGTAAKINLLKRAAAPYKLSRMITVPCGYTIDARTHTHTGTQAQGLRRGHGERGSPKLQVEGGAPTTGTGRAQHAGKQETHAKQALARRHAGTRSTPEGRAKLQLESAPRAVGDDNGLVAAIR